MKKKNKKVYITSNVSIDYFVFLCKIFKGLGYDVKSIYLISEETYRLSAKKLNLNNLYLRIQMYIFYPIYILFLGLISCKSSIFIVSSNTFFAPFLMHILLKFKGNKIIHMLYDLYPDAIEVSGLKPTHSSISLSTVFSNKLLVFETWGVSSTLYTSHNTIELFDSKGLG